MSRNVPPNASIIGGLGQVLAYTVGWCTAG